MPRMLLVAAVAALLSACHPPAECAAPSPSDGGLMPLGNPCVADGGRLPDGSPCCLGASVGKCESGECVLPAPSPARGPQS